FRQCGILGWIQFGQSRADNRDGAAFSSERTLMSSRINAPRQSANHRQPCVRKLIGEFLGRFCSVMCSASRADNIDRVMIAVLKFSQDVEHNRRRMDLA